MTKYGNNIMTGIVEFRESPTSVLASDSNANPGLNAKVAGIRDSELYPPVTPNSSLNFLNSTEVIDPEVMDIIILALKDLKMKRTLEIGEAIKNGTVDTYELKCFDYKDLVEAAAKRIQEAEEAEKNNQEEQIERFEGIPVEYIKDFIRVAIISMIVGCLFEFSS